MKISSSLARNETAPLLLAVIPFSGGNDSSHDLQKVELDNIFQTQKMTTHLFSYTGVNAVPQRPVALIKTRFKQNEVRGLQKQFEIRRQNA